MKYPDGKDVLVGDEVVVDGDGGLVVANIDEGWFSKRYPEGSWSHLGKGALIETNALGLVHYETFDDVPILLKRRGMLHG